MGIENVGIRMHNWIRCRICLSSHHSLTEMPDMWSTRPLVDTFPNAGWELVEKSSA
jgi:hypothetical protein